MLPLMSHAPAPYPLLFTPILKEKVWGGRRLAQLGKQLRDGALVGESWEIADLDQTSPSGGGGDAAHSVIRNGALAGRVIRDAAALWGSKLLGDASPDASGAFPLLIKFLDADQNLSVQTHPSESYAQAHPEAHIKHEAWCVIAARPGAMIYRGVRKGVTRDDMRRRTETNTVEEALVGIPAAPGQIVHLPSGVVHALGAGVLVAEVQTPSDTTFRLYDWGREGRELHIDAALECAFGPDGAPTVPLDALPAPNEREVKTHAFVIQSVRATAGQTIQEPLTGDSPVILIMLAGSARIDSSTGQFEPQRLCPGDTALLPAALSSPRLFFETAAWMLRVTTPARA